MRGLPSLAGRELPARRVLFGGAAAVVVVVVVAVLLLSGGGGSPEERRAAVQASERLATSVASKPTPTSRRLCAAVGERTQEKLAALAPFLPTPRRECRNIPNRLLRAALEPLPDVAGKPLSAEIDGDVGVVSVKDGPEVSRATRTGGQWRADPGEGGLGAWRLETAMRCSRALSSSRTSPLSTDPTGYRRAVTVRLRGVSDVLEMLQDDELPAALDGLVGEPRSGLVELRDGLRSALQATDSGDAGTLARDAPDSSELPSVLQLLEAFVSLRELGAPCLGGPSSPTAVALGNDICLDYRQQIDKAYKNIGRAVDETGVATGFRLLASTWRKIAVRVQRISLTAAPSLVPVQADAVRSAQSVARTADLLAGQAGTGSTSETSASDLDLAQQSSLDAMMALGFRECGAIS